MESSATMQVQDFRGIMIYSSEVLCTPASIWNKQTLSELTIHFLNQVALGSTRARKCSGVRNCSSDDSNSGSELVENRLKVLARTASRNLNEMEINIQSLYVARLLHAHWSIGPFICTKKLTAANRDLLMIKDEVACHVKM